jgi:SAM-dependent methyltransferase
MVEETMWSPGAADWAEVMEGPSGWGIPVYARILDLVQIGEETHLLDVGCGAGRFCRIARDRGAEVTGLDATRELVEIARQRTPDGEFDVGEMEDLPWDDDSFDVVTGFNSFFLARDMVGALREARRVARPGGTLALTIFGRPERSDSTTLFAAMGRLVGSGPPAADAPALHEESVISGIVREAGLTPVDCEYLQFDEEYPDVETLARGMLAAPPGRRAALATSVDEVTAALALAAQPLVTGGAVRLREEVRYVVAAT